MAKVVVDNQYAPYFWVLRAIFAGAIIGVLAWGISSLLHKAFLGNILCNGESLCMEAASAAGVVASAIASALGIFLLALLKVPRALFVAVASFFVTWKVQGYIWGLWWGEAIMWSAVAFAIAYLLFSIVGHIKRWALLVTVTLGIIIAVQIILMLY